MTHQQFEASWRQQERYIARVKRFFSRRPEAKGLVPECPPGRFARIVATEAHRRWTRMVRRGLIEKRGAFSDDLPKRER